MSQNRTARRENVTRLVQVALLIAIEILMTFTPIGFIPIPFLGINATLVHIPVIVGGALLGPGTGALLGGVFGLCSIAKNTFLPLAVSFVFSPFIASGIYGAEGVCKSLFISLVPRILVGVVAGLVAGASRKARFRYLAAGVAGSMTNTLLVLGSIYVLYGRAYAETIGRSYELLLGYLLGVISVSGVCEAVLAAVVTAALAPVLRRMIQT